MDGLLCGTRDAEGRAAQRSAAQHVQAAHARRKRASCARHVTHCDSTALATRRTRTSAFSPQVHPRTHFRCVYRMCTWQCLAACVGGSRRTSSSRRRTSSSVSSSISSSISLLLCLRLPIFAEGFSDSGIDSSPFPRVENCSAGGVYAGASDVESASLASAVDILSYLGVSSSVSSIDLMSTRWWDSRQIFRTQRNSLLDSEYKFMRLSWTPFEEFCTSSACS